MITSQPPSYLIMEKFCDLGGINRTSGGNLYFFGGDSSGSGVFYICKSTNSGSTWSIIATLTQADIWTGDVRTSEPKMLSYRTAIDGNGIIHIAAARWSYYQEDYYAWLRYATLNTANDTLSAWESAYDAGGSNMAGECDYYGISLCLDNNGYPWIFFVDSVNSYTAYLGYVEKTTGSWSAKARILESLGEDYYQFISAVVTDADTITVFYGLGSGGEESLLVQRIGGTWGTSGSYFSSSAFGKNNNLIVDDNGVWHASANDWDTYNLFKGGNGIFYHEGKLCMMSYSSEYGISKTEDEGYNWQPLDWRQGISSIGEYSKHFQNSGKDIDFVFRSHCNRIPYYICVKDAVNVSDSVHAYLEGVTTRNKAVTYKHAYLKGVTVPHTGTLILQNNGIEALDIVLNTEGHIYIAIGDYNNQSIYFYRSVDDGASFSLLNTQLYTDIFGYTRDYVELQFAADNVGNIYMVASGTSYNSWIVTYNKFDIDGNLGSWENTIGGCNGRIAVGADGTLHSVVTSMSANHEWLSYLSKTSGSWIGAQDLYPYYDASAICREIVVLDSSHLYVSVSLGLMQYDLYRTSGSWHGPYQQTGYQYQVQVGRSFLALPDNSKYYYFVLDTVTQHLFCNQVDTGMLVTNPYQQSISGSLHKGVVRAFVSNNYSLPDSDGRWSGDGVPYTNVSAYVTPIAAWNHFYEMSTQIGRINIVFATLSEPHAVYYTYVDIPGEGRNSTSVPACLVNTQMELKPNSDIFVGNWQNETSGSVLYPSVADEDDATYAWYQSAPIGAYFEVKLQSKNWGTVGGGTIVWKAYRKAGTSTATIKCELRQGSSTVIASDTQTLTDDVQVFFKQLSSGEFSSISDRTDLRLRITLLSAS